MIFNIIKVVFTLLFFAVLPAKAQQDYVIRSTMVEQTLTIDGILDEPEWGNAEVIRQFVQREPSEGSPATRMTEIRILFGTDNVYIGAVMYAAPAEIENTLGRRDEFTRADWLLVSFDSYFNRRTAYTFAINAAGVQLDGIQGWIPTTGTTVNSRIEGLDTSWDAIWFSAVRITDEGWNAEIRIPYSMLRFPGVEEQTWGLHITRRIPRLGEVTEWPYIPWTERANLVARYGQIQGIRNLEPRRNLQIRPYLLTGLDIFESASNPGKGETKTRFDVGGDIKVGLGPNTMLDATVNPDFGQVEADPAVLNLTAFETLYTEKRPFLWKEPIFSSSGLAGAACFTPAALGRVIRLSGQPKCRAGRLVVYLSVYWEHHRGTISNLHTTMA